MKRNLKHIVALGICLILMVLSVRSMLLPASAAEIGMNIKTETITLIPAADGTGTMLFTMGGAMIIAGGIALLLTSGKKK